MTELVFPALANLMQSKSNTYCIIGDPVQYSLSPAMYNAVFNSLGLNSIYIAFRVPKGELKESIDSLRAINISGFNVTIPHKIEVINYIDSMDSTAHKANAVNTVHNIRGLFRAYNTDIYGFIHPLHTRHVKFNGMTILLIGAGGAARAVVAALSAEKDISKIIIANRSQLKAKQLSEIGTKLGLKCNLIPWQMIQEYAKTANLIVNTTAVGMNNEKSVIDYHHINKDSIVYDIVYKPATTDLLENAKYAGAQVIYGYEMLLNQGARSFEIWTGLPAPVDVMKKALLGTFGEPV
jgi:shikimate dehydrogenase